MADPNVVEQAKALYAQIQSPIPWDDLTPDQQLAWINRAVATQATSSTYIAG